MMRAIGGHPSCAYDPRFGLDLDGSIEDKPMHSMAMLRFFRLRSVNGLSKDWTREVKVLYGQALIEICTRLASEKRLLER